jgi:hypothetical protein
MSSPLSPYKEHGLAARARPKHKKDAEPTGYAGTNDPSLIKSNHKWGPGFDRLSPCKRCGKPRFAVELKACVKETRWI